LEQLESRTLLSVYPLNPMQVRHAYGFDALPLSSNDGTGKTIAIIDAYTNPNISSDLDTFDQTYGVTSGQTLYQQYGAASKVLSVHKMGRKIQGSYDWGVEMSLDVQWAHSVAPGAHILLVEAVNSSLSSLLAAVDWASSQSGVVAVSMSWGSNEFSGESSYDSHFSHSGITYVASSGDTGSVTSWPAVAPNVVGVGGTSLNTDASGNYLGETGWSNSYGGSGGGVSSYESKPSYQVNVPQSSSQRTSPDVAYNGDVNTGVAVYDSYYSGGGGWFQVGGTSAGAPQWAALTAIADQGRTSGSLSSSDTLNTLYSLLSNTNTINTTYLQDITTGGPPATHAAPGYDLSTGLGTPRADQLIPLLRSTTLAPVQLAASNTTSSVTSQLPPTGNAPKQISPALALAAQITSHQFFNAIANNAASNAVSTLVAPALQAPAPSPVVLSSTPVPATDSGTVLNRLDSGGGALVSPADDTDADSSSNLPARPADSKTPPRAMPARPASSQDDGKSAPQPADEGSEETSAGFFFGALPITASEWVGQPAPGEASLTEETGLAFEPGAVVAALALVLATSWSDGQAKEDESQKEMRL
jgi:hypothetical protein